MADATERLIAEGVLYRLDTPEFAAALAGRGPADEQAAGLAEQVAADEDQLQELAGLYGQRAVSAAEWRAARVPIEARITEGRRRLARLTHSGALEGYVGNGDALRARWPSLNLDRQRAIVVAVLDHAVVGPGSRGATRLHPAGGGFKPPQAALAPMFRP